MARHPLSVSPGYDDKRRWGKSELWRKPDHVDVPYWQRRINDIYGMKDGQPIVRLVWAWEPQQFFFYEWDSAGNGIKGEKRPQYEFLAVPLSNGRTLPICAPRWVLEERQEPEQFLAGWEASRYIIKPGSTIIDPSSGQPISKRLDLRGDPPAGAQYMFARYVAAHEPNKTCCDRAHATEEGVCFGFYREPDEQMIALLRKAKADHDADIPLRVDPFQPLERQQGVLEEIERRADNQAADQRQKLRDDLDDIYRPFNKAHGWRAFTDSRKALKWGKWQSAYPLTEFKGEKKDD